MLTCTLNRPKKAITVMADNANVPEDSKISD